MYLLRSHFWFAARTAVLFCLCCIVGSDKPFADDYLHPVIYNYSKEPAADRRRISRIMHFVLLRWPNVIYQQAVDKSPGEGGATYWVYYVLFSRFLSRVD